MVYLSYGDIPLFLKNLQPGKRMPFLCAVNRTFGCRIISENYEEHVRGVRSDQFDINEAGGYCENYLTCMSISENSGIAAIGSGAKGGNLYFIKDMSAVEDILSGPRFKQIHKETLDIPIHSLDWSGNHLLVGTQHGVCRLYNIVFEDAELRTFALLGQYTNSPSEIAINAPSYTVNTHVKSVEFSPSYSSVKVDLDQRSISSSNCSVQSQFLSTTVNQLSIWDASCERTPVNRIQASQSPLNCASWSPNDPQSLIVCGGYERKLVIIDTRVDTKNSVAWSVDNAHDRPIRDAKFNPFIPYWLASAGEDSVTNIWDIRTSSHAPVAKIDGNVGIITSVSWSNIRPENIGTTSSDGTMRYWTLSPEYFPVWDTHYRIGRYNHQDTLPIVRERDQNNIWFTKDQNYKYKNAKPWKTDVWDDEEESNEKRSAMMLSGALGLGEWGKPEPGTIYKGEKLVHANGAVITVKASKLRPSMYYSITNGGQFTAHTVRFDTASNLRNRHRFDQKDKDEIAAQIEDAIYCRRVTEARRKLDILKSTTRDNQHEEDQRLEEVSFLEDCLKVREPIKSSDWSFDSIPDTSGRRSSRRSWKADDNWEYAINNFKSDLKYWSYRIPPGYNTRYKFPLEFDGPIIAPHLVEEDTLVTQIPLLANEALESSADLPNDAHLPPLYSASFGSNIKEQTNSDPISQLNINTTSKANRKTSITDRRNITNIPSIVTVNYDNAITGKQPSSSFHQMTPPYSALAAHHFDQELASSNNNPFENRMIELSEKSPIDTPQPTNPFIENNPPRSTNPFENASVIDPVNVTMGSPYQVQRQEEGRKDDIINSGLMSVSTTPISNVNSIGSSVEDTESPKSAKSPHKRLSNPFKRIMSRHGHKDDDNSGQLRVDPVPGLSRKASNRRNALHGPF